MIDDKGKKLGEKIRDLRLSHSLTQTELAGDSITRNMLSLIESGRAVPSLSTLCELAERLQVPIGYFFASDDEENTQFLKMSMIGEIRCLLKSRNYAECVSLCSTLSHPDDEIQLILAQCYLELAGESLQRYALVTTTELLKKSSAAASECVYESGSISQTADYISLLIRSVNHEILPEELGLPHIFPLAWIPAEFFTYIRILYLLQAGDLVSASALEKSGLILTSSYRNLILAKTQIAKEQYAEAVILLRSILTEKNSGFFTRLQVLAALEHCSSLLGDYREAYHYSSEKVKLMELFSQ